MPNVFNKPEVWVIDSAPTRRNIVSQYLDFIGYLAFPIDPAEAILKTHGRSVIAMVNDEENVIDNLLVHMVDSPISYVVYSDCLKAKRIADLSRRGVADFLDWPFDKREFVDAVLTAENNLSSIVEDGWRGATARKRVDTLTQREKEVLAGVLAGKTSRNIASDFGLSHRTIEVHRRNCMHKLGVKNAIEAVKVAVNSGCFKHSVEL